MSSKENISIMKYFTTILILKTFPSLNSTRIEEAGIMSVMEFSHHFPQSIKLISPQLIGRNEKKIFKTSLRRLFQN